MSFPSLNLSEANIAQSHRNNTWQALVLKEETHICTYWKTGWRSQTCWWKSHCQTAGWGSWRCCGYPQAGPSRSTPSAGCCCPRGRPRPWGCREQSRCQTRWSGGCKRGQSVCVQGASNLPSTRGFILDTSLYRPPAISHAHQTCSNTSDKEKWGSGQLRI